MKGGKTRDTPLPAVVLQNLNRYVSEYLPTQVEDVTLGTPLFWPTFGQRREGLVGRAPIDHPTLEPTTIATAWRQR